MQIDATTAPLISAAIAALAAIAGSLLTQIFSKTREKLQESNSKKSEFFEAKKRAYGNLLKGITLYKKGDVDNEFLSDALIWIELFSPEGIKSYIKKWHLSAFRHNSTEEAIVWSAIRIDLINYYEEIHPSHYLNITSFVWQSSIFRTWLIVSTIWYAKIFFYPCNINIDMLFELDKRLWPVVVLFVAGILLFIGSGHRYIIYDNWFSDIIYFAKDKLKTKNKI